MNPYDKNIFLRKLISHDGITDALTGLMTFQSFQESAVRLLAHAARSQESVNIFLLSLAEYPSTTHLSTTQASTTQADQKPVNLVIRPNRDIANFHESEIVELADRILQSSHTLKNGLRLNDLVARYTFADFLILNVGDFGVISEKVKKIAERIFALSAALEIDTTFISHSSSGNQELRAVEKDFSEVIRNSIATLEGQLID